MSAVRGGEELRDADRELERLLAPFHLTPPQTDELTNAHHHNPAGVKRCALRAKATGQREGRSGAGLLLTMVRHGEHLLEPDTTAPRITGWRFQRGTHSGTYIEDPAGTDPLPPNYDFTTRSTVGRTPPPRVELDHITPELPDR